MENPTIENRIQLDDDQMRIQNALLEETLLEKDILLESLKGSEKQYRRLFESAKERLS